MVEVALSAGAVARIRFGISCLWEVAAAVRVLRDPAQHSISLPWAKRTRLPDGLLRDLIPAAPGYLADFLTPAPTGLAPDLGAELERLRATPPATVRHDLDLSAAPRTPAVVDLYANPAEGVNRLADEIQTFWRESLAAHWPRALAVLEADVFARARRLAEGGAAAVLNDLHARVRWDDATLEITLPGCTALNVAEGRGLILIPSIFVWPTVLSIAAPTSLLAYPARGAGALWETPPATPGGLTAVLGRGRARLLTELVAPVSTGELAKRLGMTAGGVSQHLGALRAAGLVAAHRDGRTVLNVRTPVGEALVTLSEDLGSRP